MTTTQKRQKIANSGLNFQDYTLNADPNAAIQIYKKQRRMEANDAADDLQVTPKQMLRVVFIILLTLTMVTFALFLVHNGYNQWMAVARARDVSNAELRQDCCMIFMKNMHSFSKEKVADCHHILQEEKQNSKINRCEKAENVLKQPFFYHWVLEMWMYYFPLARLSMLESFVKFFMGTISSSMGMYVMKKFVFQEA